MLTSLDPLIAFSHHLTISPPLHAHHLHLQTLGKEEPPELSAGFSEALRLLGAFLANASGATAIGVTTALCLSLLLRHGTLYHHSSHIEVALTVGAAYLSYAFAEWVGYSGILSLFFCGVRTPHHTDRGVACGLSPPYRPWRHVATPSSSAVWLLGAPPTIQPVMPRG